MDTDGDGLADCLDLDSANDCAADGVDAFGGRTHALVPAKDADMNCPASAPACDVTVGRCLLPEKAYSTDDVVLQGSGNSFGCSSTGDTSGFVARVSLLGLALRNRRRK